MERRDSNASDATFISLQQVDPSPIDFPADSDWDLEKQIPDLPSRPSFGRSSSLGLSGSHGPAYYREYSIPYRISLN
jgi:hypothetical protein